MFLKQKAKVIHAVNVTAYPVSFFSQSTDNVNTIHQMRVRE